ncbi:hypothetical protein C5167_024676 [Papaver somniferum]|uniref:RRM domain-containing protein n=1 Tax=Papaver somniferum TaxID=3469 RepID=A0A4Y7JP99_PAPSO|nr:hypothetical protein C5167_024676 [Papaver somniferum]
MMPQQTNGADSQQQQHQWMAMQYPAATMVMQHPHHHQMMSHQPFPPQSFIPYPTIPHHQQQQQSQQGSSEENRTIWVGDLHYWMEENYLHSCFAHTGEVASIKVIRNKQTGQSEGYGFVEFCTRAAAEKVLQTYNGSAMPNAEQPFRLNWASFSMGDKRSDVGSDRSIFVGDLASDVTDTILQETFASRYPSVKGAKVVIDANTERSKGYGFVRFGDDNERTQAITEMNGVYCSSRPMRVGVATPRKSTGFQQMSSQAQVAIRFFFIIVEMLQLRDLSPRRILLTQQINAEEALERLNGTVIGKQTVRLSWGRNPANKQRGDAGNHWNGGAGFYGGQGYDYGYAVAPPQDQAMYAAAAYGAYPMYGNHQQQVS